MLSSCRDNNRELGISKDDSESLVQKFRDRLAEKDVPTEVMDVVEDELDKLQTLVVGVYPIVLLCQICSPYPFFCISGKPFIRIQCNAKLLRLAHGFAMGAVHAGKLRHSTGRANVEQGMNTSPPANACANCVHL